MHSGRNFTLKQVVLWTRRETFWFAVIATVPTVLYVWLDIRWIAIPWLPIALVGTAVAFLIGFKNNASYDRLWEARKIWGGIVNESRTWAVHVLDLVVGEWSKDPVDQQELKAVHRRMIHRHLAWVTTLRFQLRVPREWEYMYKAYNREYRQRFHIPELDGDLSTELKVLLSAEELELVLGRSNAATQVLALQSAELRKLHKRGFIDDFRHMEMTKLVRELYVLQGMSERIKNFPYPRQFATINLFFVWLFIFLLPFGMLQVFHDMGNGLAVLTIPFTVLIAWVFHTMEKVGEASENPFQGGPTDIPITAISRTIEIDLRELLGETDIPKPVLPVRDILF